MKQKDRNSKLCGPEGFDEYYSGLFGERWRKLRESLFGEDSKVEYNAGGEKSYFLDSGSIRAAVTLPLAGANSVLDLCAAPGGKTLVLASCMPLTASLLANERSPDRKARLLRTVQDCLDESVRARVTVICKDGASLCLVKNNKFDRILLDAPCSSERHVLRDNAYLKDWSPARIKTLSIAQWALISSAWRMLTPGGYLVYSTCALNPCENDKIMGRLLKKFGDARILRPGISLDTSRFCSVQLPEGEATEFGMHILPDTSNGAGPLYFSLVQKT